MQRCPNCQAENEERSSVCFLCGQQLKKPGFFKRMFGGGQAKRSSDAYYEVDYPTPEENVEVLNPAQTSAHNPPQTPSSGPVTALEFKVLGSEHLQNGRYRLAVEANSEAIQLDPRYTDAYYNRGLAYINLGQYHEAIQDLSEAISLNNQDPDAYHNRAYAFFMLHRLDRSIADYDRAISISGNNPELYIGRGAAYFEREEYLRSIGDFDQAITLGEHAHAYANRAVSYVRLGKLDDAEADIRRARERGFDPQKAIEELQRERNAGSGPS